MSFHEFVIIYSWVKCAKTMLVASVLMILVLGVCGARTDRHAPVNTICLLLVPLMCLTGGSKLFFTGEIVYIHNFLFDVPYLLCVVYFGIALILLALYLGKEYLLRYRVRKLPVWRGKENYRDFLREVMGEKNLSIIGKWYLSRIKVYVTEQNTSPFSGGLIHPYIVLPWEIAEEWSEEERKVVFSHELFHILSGHIWMLTIYQLLKIYWWVNPLIYLCDKELKRNQEYLCDTKSVLENEVDSHHYGMILLKIAHLQNTGDKTLELNENVATFSGNHFQDLKRRIMKLGKNKLLKRVRENHISETHMRRMEKWYRWMGAVVVFAVCILIRMTSYPHFTKIQEVTLYDQNYQLLVWDLRELDLDLQVQGAEISYNPDKMKEILEEYQVDVDYILLAYGSIMKEPGIGGNGQVALIYTDELDEVYYLSKDCWQNKLSAFVLKYLI